ncbi:hypothetical protein FRC02_011731 [Tulasnella sp. 418]|nr:hypothetical protein FRC02_011731 [Tulasnella sp. 418]
MSQQGQQEKTDKTHVVMSQILVCEAVVLTLVLAGYAVLLYYLLRRIRTIENRNPEAAVVAGPPSSQQPSPDPSFIQNPPAVTTLTTICERCNDQMPRLPAPSPDVPQDIEPIAGSSTMTIPFSHNQRPPPTIGLGGRRKFGQPMEPIQEDVTRSSEYEVGA